MNKRDRELGMNRNITRRDFLNGVALTVGASLLPSHLLGGEEMVFAPEQAAGYYPPALTGLRGDHEGSFEAAHDVRDGNFWEHSGSPVDSKEEYDLVVVGGGISGLSAAYFFRKQAGPDARILILDNHDDFGGHAKRNEFRSGNRTIIGFGGVWSIESPAPYSATAKGLISELGIDVSRFSKVVDAKLYPSLGLKSSVFFDKETFGSDRLLPSWTAEFEAVTEDEASKDTWKRFLARAPMAEQSKIDLIKVCTANTDYMPGLTPDQKKAKLATMSYSDFLTKVIGAHPDVVKFFQARPHPLFGVGTDAVSAQDAWGLGMPGFQGMALDQSFGKGMNRDAMQVPGAGDDWFFHFPDGGATIARSLVRKLIPSAIPGKTVDDIVTARCNYARLDRADWPCRIRLNSTVARVQHVGEVSAAKQVEVAYVRGGKVQTVRAKHCIMACWHVVIPYICQEIPSAQKQDLAYEVKVPIVYTNVQIANWKSFVKAGVSSIHCPGAYHSAVYLDMPVSMGDYKCTKKPEESIVVHLMRTPCKPGLPARDQHRAGRMELLGTTFEDFEHNIRDQFARMLGPSGFDPARDIQAITVNRWPHGYAYQYNSLFDSFWLEGQQTPCERARKPYGLISIANADAGAYAYMDGAIDQGYRAATEALSARG